MAARRRIAWRWSELRMLLPLALLVPLGFAVTHIAQTNVLDPGPLGLAIGYRRDHARRAFRAGA